MHKSLSLFHAKNMHEWIIDKTCIDRIIQHKIDCFHYEQIIESSVCGMSFSKRISIEDASWKFFILQDTV